MDDTENDLFWHALNYRTAAAQDADMMWRALQACVERLVAAEREACAKVCENFDFNNVIAIESPRTLTRYCAAAIRRRNDPHA